MVLLVLLYFWRGSFRNLYSLLSFVLLFENFHEKSQLSHNQILNLNYVKKRLSD